MAMRQIKPIDWAKLQERISPALKSKFNAFKGKSDTIMVNYLKAKDKKLTIDWTYYHQAVANKALVKEFEAKFNSLKVPQPEDTKSEILEKNIERDNKRVQDFIKESNDSMADTLSEIERLNSLPPFEQMTTEDVFQNFKSLRPDYDTHPPFGYPLEEIPKRPMF